MTKRDSISADELFDGIVEGLQDAIAHAQGDANRAQVHTVAPIDVSAIRSSLGLSQTQFAARFGFSVATVRAWEQGRRAPRGPARTLLHVLAHNPDAVTSALAATRAK
jgi:putative transcriptional regulator